MKKLPTYKMIPLWTIVFIFLLWSCSATKSLFREADPGLNSVNGNGNVKRTALDFRFMNSANKDTIVDFVNYALPPGAHFPSNTFEGKLTLNHLDISGKFLQIKGRYRDSGDGAWKHLPPFDYEFIQSGSHIIPIKRGYIENEHPVWEYILEPGRVWDEKGDNGFSRVAIPFTLKQKNQNCLHNGVLMFLFKNNGSISKVTYQIASETCAYFKFDMWGTISANYTPFQIASGEKYISDYVSEVKGRMPVRPISDLGKYYAGANPQQFAAPKGVSQKDMTFYGFVIDGVNYVGGCQTRKGKYPFCEVLDVPSYSTAKSISAALGLMRLEKLYPGANKQFIGNLIPACGANGNWKDVTMENALDMSTGNYDSLKAFADEGAPHTQRFFSSETHMGKIDYSCNIYPRKSPPGTEWVYHTSDTYILGTAMNAYLKMVTKNPQADYFSDILVKDIFEPLGTSPTFKKQQRTYDSVAQPFSGFGLIFHYDDVAKIGQFLNNGARIDNQEMLDKKMFSSVMQPDGNSGLKATATTRYDNGFWLQNIDIPGTGIANIYVSNMEGYGGIKIFLLPNNTVYYYFSDNYEYVWKEGITESNHIRPFINKNKSADGHP